jgi:hypothetical protein
MPLGSRCYSWPSLVTSRQSQITKSCTIRTSAKQACNSHRIRTFKTQSLKPFRICSCEKQGRGVGILLLTRRPMTEGSDIVGSVSVLYDRRERRTSPAVLSRSPIPRGIPVPIEAGGSLFTNLPTFQPSNLPKLCYSNKSGCSRVMRSHSGWNWNHPTIGIPTCVCVSFAVS